MMHTLVRGSCVYKCDQPGGAITHRGLHPRHPARDHPDVEECLFPRAVRRGPSGGRGWVGAGHYEGQVSGEVPSNSGAALRRQVRGAPGLFGESAQVCVQGRALVQRQLRDPPAGDEAHEPQVPSAQPHPLLDEPLEVLGRVGGGDAQVRRV